MTTDSTLKTQALELAAATAAHIGLTERQAEALRWAAGSDTSVRGSLACAVLRVFDRAKSVVSDADALRGLGYTMAQFTRECRMARARSIGLDVPGMLAAIGVSL